MGFSDYFDCGKSINEMGTDPWGETNSPVVSAESMNQFENNFEVESSFTPLHDSPSYIQALGESHSPALFPGNKVTAVMLEEGLPTF